MSYVFTPLYLTCNMIHNGTMFCRFSGYPPSCLVGHHQRDRMAGNGEPRKVTLHLDMDQAAFTEKVWDILPVLRRAPFETFKRDKCGRLVVMGINTPKDIKESKYRSIILVCPVLNSRDTEPPSLPSNLPSTSEAELPSVAAYMHLRIG